jgi:hypothetical protein
MRSLVVWKNPHGLIQMFAFFLFFLFIFSWSGFSFNSFNMHSIYGSYVQKLHLGGRVSLCNIKSFPKSWPVELKAFYITSFLYINRLLLLPEQSKIILLWLMNFSTLSSQNEVVEALWLLKLTWRKHLIEWNGISC